MNNLHVLGKFLDQPVLVAKFQKAVPAVLAAGSAAYAARDVMKQDKDKRSERALKTGITMGVTVASALAAPRIASKITKRALPDTLNIVKNKNRELIGSFIENNQVDDISKSILEKGKEKILNFKEVKRLFTNLQENEQGGKFLKKMIPDPENIKAKDIFSEIGYLSIYGAVPVAGGIAGGIIADRITDKNNWKEKIPNKIKEGSYQYLANIFMCNVGAGIVLGLLEKAGIRSKGARALGMTAGIILTGVIGGSKIANIIGDKIIDPICNAFSKKNKIAEENPFDILDIDFVNHKSNPYMADIHVKHNKQRNERTPEPLDICLHTDDIATVSMLSGLKWIEPALPVLYTVSGYRAGAGYRN